MKIKILMVSSLLLAVAMLFGCVNTEANNPLADAENNLLLEYNSYDSEGAIPHDVNDALDYLLKNYTDGIKKLDADDFVQQEVTDDEQKKDIKKDSIETQTEEAIAAVLLDALRETKAGFKITIPASLYRSDMIIDVYDRMIENDYIVESMGFCGYTIEYYKDNLNDTVVLDVEIFYMNYDGPPSGCSLEELRRMKIEVKREAERVVERLKLKSLSEYERVKAVNEYLCDKVTYSDGEPPYEAIQYTAYGALINGDCVCEGYAKAAQLLFQMCGIETYYLYGDTAGGPHGWNLVKVDGKYYQLDITWNDTGSDRGRYFLVTDEFMRNSRVWDESRYPESADKPYKG